jgi:hypothetical protein
MRCPICGGKAGYRCYAHGEYNFASDSREAVEESNSARGQSRTNAAAIRGEVAP